MYTYEYIKVQYAIAERYIARRVQNVHIPYRTIDEIASDILREIEKSICMHQMRYTDNTDIRQSSYAFMHRVYCRMIR